MIPSRAAYRNGHLWPLRGGGRATPVEPPAAAVQVQVGRRREKQKVEMGKVEMGSRGAAVGALRQFKLKWGVWASCPLSAPAAREDHDRDGHATDLPSSIFYLEVSAPGG
jgi:hypothetical protein